MSGTKATYDSKEQFSFGWYKDKSKNPYIDPNPIMPSSSIMIDDSKPKEKKIEEEKLYDLEQYDLDMTENLPEMTEYEAKNKLKEFIGYFDILSTIVKPENLNGYGQYGAGAIKFELAKSVETLYGKKAAQFMLDGVNYSPNWYLAIKKILEKDPSLLEATKEQRDWLVKAMGYNGDLSEKELNILAIRMMGIPLIKEYGPFQNAERMPDKAILSYSLGNESVFSGLTKEQIQKIAPEAAKNIDDSLFAGFEPKSRIGLESKLTRADQEVARALTENPFERQEILGQVAPQVSTG